MTHAPVAPHVTSQDSETPCAATTSDVNLLDTIHAAFLAGYDLGLARGAQFADEDRARAILHEQAARAVQEAVDLAYVSKGPAWAEVIREQAAA